MWQIGVYVFLVLANLSLVFAARSFHNSMWRQLNALSDWVQALHDQVQGQHRDLASTRNTLLYVGGSFVSSEEAVDRFLQLFTGEDHDPRPLHGPGF